MDNAFSKPIAVEIPHENQTVIQYPIRPEADTSKADKNIPVSLYAERFHKPYASEYLGMDNNFLVNLDKETMGKLRGLDEFVIQHIQEKGLKDTKGTYNKFVNSLLKVLGIDETEKPIEILNKVHMITQLRKLLK